MSRANRRRDKSSPAHELPLEDSNGFHLCHVGIRDAREGVEEGVYRPFYKAYRLGTPKHERELVKVQLTSNRVPSLKVRPPITRGEAAAYAGLHGKSRTANLTEQQKQLRADRIRELQNRVVPREDHIECAIAKVTLWPGIGDTKAVRVGPPVDAAAIALAEELDFQRRMYPAPEQP